MNIDTYHLTFRVKVARFKEFNDHNKGELLRNFFDLMKAEGSKQDFLVADTEIMIEKESEN